MLEQDVHVHICTITDGSTLSCTIIVWDFFKWWNVYRVWMQHWAEHCLLNLVITAPLCPAHYHWVRPAGGECPCLACVCVQMIHSVQVSSVSRLTFPPFQCKNNFISPARARESELSQPAAQWPTSTASCWHAKQSSYANTCWLFKTLIFEW